jgi:hypothetical protein
MSAHLMDLSIQRCGTMDRRKCPDSVARNAFDNYLGYWGCTTADEVHLTGYSGLRPQ